MQTTRTRFMAAGTLASALLAMAAATASPAAAHGHAPAQPPQQQSRPSAIESRVTVTFPGGPLREYIAALKSSVKETPINVVVQEGVDEIRVPRIDLVDVNLVTALQILDFGEITLSDSRVLRPLNVTSVDDHTDSPVWIIGMRPPEPGSTFGDKNVPAAEDLATTVQVYSVREIIEGEGAIPAEDLLTAITVTLEIGSPEKGQHELRLHRETGTLVLRATGAQVRAVDTLVANISSDQRQRRRDLVSAAKEKLETDHRMRITQLSHESARERLKIAEQGYAQAQSLHGAGAAGEKDVRSARAELEAARADVLRQQAEIEHARQSLDLLRQRVGVGAGGGDETVASLRAQVEALKAQVQALRAELAQRPSGK